jgi:hypothetical protein
MGRTGEERCVRRSGATPSSGHTSATAASASPPSLPWECRWGAALPLKRGQAHRELPPSQARRRRLMPSYCCWWRYRKKCVTSCSGKRRAPHGARKIGCRNKRRMCRHHGNLLSWLCRPAPAGALSGRRSDAADSAPSRKRREDKCGPPVEKNRKNPGKTVGRLPWRRHLIVSAPASIHRRPPAC